MILDNGVWRYMHNVLSLKLIPPLCWICRDRDIPLNLNEPLILSYCPTAWDSYGLTRLGL